MTLKSTRAIPSTSLLKARQVSPTAFEPGVSSTGLSQIGSTNRSSCCLGQWDLLSTQVSDDFAQALGQRPPTLVVIDTLTRSMIGANENEVQVVGRLFESVRKIQTAVRTATVLLIHHNRKDGGGPHGSSVIQADVSTLMSASKKGSIVTLRCEKQRDGKEFDPLAFELVPFGAWSCALRERPLNVSVIESSPEDRIRVLLRQAPEGMPAADLIQQIGKAAFYEAVKVLIKNGEVEKTRSGKRVIYLWRGL